MKNNNNITYVCLFFLVYSMACKTGNEMQYDIIIKNAEIIDGSGNDSFVGDVGIIDGSIVKIGEVNGNAEKLVDALGYILTPGFIDVHSHAASGLTQPDRSNAMALLTQGLTTVFVNPDGGGATDLDKQTIELLQDGLGINVAQMTPHGSIRKEVMGMEDRFATEEEIGEMAALVKREMEKGAFGLSSGPFYAPGSFSNTEELVALSKQIKPYGGVYTSHIRDESNYSIGLEAAVYEVITIAREAEVTGIVTHIKALGPPVWNKSNDIVNKIEKARSEGVSVYADQYPYPASATGLSAALIPRWAEAGGRKKLLMRISNRDTLAIIKKEIIENLKRRGGPERIKFRYFAPDSTVAGKSLKEVCDMWGMNEVDATIELVKQTGSIGIVSYNMIDEDIHRFMKQDWTMTCSDGSYPKWGSGVPHPRFIGSFPRKINHYVVKEKVVSLPHAIRSMTGLSADVFGLNDRGYIREGYIADIAIFRKEEIKDNATFELPFNYSTGIQHLIVNGSFSILDGVFLDAMNGKVLKKVTD